MNLVDIKEQIFDSISVDSLLELTESLVSIPSINPPGEEKKCAEFIHGTLTGWGIESVLVFEPFPDRPQVVATVRGSEDGKTVVLNGHIDTVDPGGSELWNTPPLQATRIGNNLYGLGTCDMKGSLAICMLILKAVKELYLDLPGTVVFQAAVGEEMAEDGTRVLLQKGYRGDYAVVLEPTDLRIATASRGAVWYQISITGMPIHCGLVDPSTPDIMDFLLCFGEELKTYHRKVSQQNHQLMKPPGCRITKLHLGEAHNSIPAKCEVVIDRRMIPGEDFEQVLRDLEEILDRVKKKNNSFEYSIQYIRGNEPSEIHEQSKLVKVFKENIQSIGKSEPEMWATPFGSDMRNFVVDAGIPTVNFGAGDFQVCHKPNEFVPIEDLTMCAKIVTGAVIDLLNLENN